MRTDEFAYDLPPELIAQHPARERDQSRLLAVDRTSGALQHLQFANLPSLLRRGDVLVVNNSRVIPARLRGRKAGTGGDLEILLAEEIGRNDWWVLIRPGKRVRPGTEIDFRKPNGQPTPLRAEVVDKNAEGQARLRFKHAANILDLLPQIGEVPLPPYIQRPSPANDPQDRLRYQTIYADPPGSVAAPTAGLHFSPTLLETLHDLDILICPLTLHVGLATFAPLKAENLEDHPMHEERFDIPASTADTINAARDEGRRIVAVGTTTVRALESVAAIPPHHVLPGPDRTRLFIRPPHKFRVVDALITNFHLPQSTLLVLVSAFAAPGSILGRELILRAYGEAIQQRYRFFSYGDAMILL